jgi:tetratricopeptide (TPR) repeat protein
MRRVLFSIFVIFAAYLNHATAQTVGDRKEFERGIGLAREGRFESARNVFDDLLKAASLNEFERQFQAKLHYNLGACEFRLGEAKRAAAEFEAAIELAGGDYEKAFYALGMAYGELGNWPSAKAAFHRALLANDRNGETWFDLAFVYLELNDPDNAFVAFENAVRHKSSASAYALNNLGVISAQRGKTAAARLFFEKALAKSGGRLRLAKDNLEFTNARAFAARP